ncbi:hypothetical protein ACJX0J_022456, partial [Zea mays]
ESSTQEAEELLDHSVWLELRILSQIVNGFVLRDGQMDCLSFFAYMFVLYCFYIVLSRYCFAFLDIVLSRYYFVFLDGVQKLVVKNMTARKYYKGIKITEFVTQNMTALNNTIWHEGLRVQVRIWKNVEKN